MRNSISLSVKLLTTSLIRNDLDVLIGVLGFSGGLPRNRILEDLSTVDLFLDTPTGDESVDNNIPILPNTECSINSLGVSGRVPTWIICYRNFLILQNIIFSDARKLQNFINNIFESLFKVLGNHPEFSRINNV